MFALVKELFLASFASGQNPRPTVFFVALAKTAYLAFSDRFMRNGDRHGAFVVLEDRFDDEKRRRISTSACKVNVRR
jgi:hypothetical protein